MRSPQKLSQCSRFCTHKRDSKGGWGVIHIPDWQEVWTWERSVCNRGIMQQQMMSAQIVWDVDTQQVKLVLATGIHDAILPGPQRPAEATTLAIPLHRTTTIGLFTQIRDFANVMGWPLPKA